MSASQASSSLLGGPIEWLPPGGCGYPLAPGDGYLITEEGVMVALTWRAGRQVALLDAPTIPEPCAIHAEPASAPGHYVVTTLELERINYPGPVHRRAVIAAHDALDALRQVLLGDEGHPWHSRTESGDRPSLIGVQLLHDD
jgi:hypothetical protein